MWKENLRGLYLRPLLVFSWYMMLSTEEGKERQKISFIFNLFQTSLLERFVFHIYQVTFYIYTQIQSSFNLQLFVI